MDDRTHLPGELEALRRRARAWIEGDPDPVTRRQLAACLEADDVTELRTAVAEPLSFGTAGLRGPVGPGPARMNRASVIRASRALAEHALAAWGGAAPLAVVGFDARRDSGTFARDVVGVLAAAGLEVRWLPVPAPTPLIAYAARALEATTAVVITASHNPASDNGYKVYGPDAVQIAAPTDVEIAAVMARLGPAGEVPRHDPATSARVAVLDEGLATRYLGELAGARSPVTGPPVRLVYTPLHGVGGELATRALRAAGHADVHVVASQARPDGSFPTLAAPNPQEPGTLDAALALAAEVDADAVLANDPDADRLAMAVRDGRGSHRVLTGNEIGVLLGDLLLERTRAARPLVVSSVVSTPMFADVAAAHGARHESTLTGFKWICRAALAVARGAGHELVLGYEEALGYAVGEVVRDKDGIGAAVAAADAVRHLAGQGTSVPERLAALFERHGLWVDRQRSLALEGPGGRRVVADALDALVTAPPGRLGTRAVTGVVDHRAASPDAPPWRGATDLVELSLAGGRALLRPSGTEPMVKVYVDLRAERRGELASQRAGLLDEADAVADAVLRAAGLSAG